MPSASINLKQNDVISRVPAFPGVGAAICIPALRGPVGVATDCGGEADILAQFTERGRIEVGYDLAYYSASNFSLTSEHTWVVRPDNGSEYGGATLTSAAGNGGAGVASSVNLTDPDTYVFGVNDLALITGSDPGSWNNNLAVMYRDNSAKQANTFYIDVYQFNVLVETNLVSRVVGTKDYSGNNIYIEDRLKQSAYIRAVDNINVAGTIAPKFGSNTPIAFTNGDDGDPVTDAMMIAAMQVFRDSESIDITLLLDGGRATPGYAGELASIATERNDAIALLSVPYAVEAAADYMTGIAAYVNTLGVNTSAAAIYSPHVQVSDRFNDRKLWISPESFAGCVICTTADNYEIFYAPAGSTAIVNVEDVLRRYSKNQRDTLADARVNPLRYQVNKGVKIWGQKTLLTTDGYLTRLNVKFLMITVEPAITAILEDFQFQFSDPSTWAVIKARVDGYLDGIQGKRGLTEYTTIIDASNNPQSIRDQNIIQITVNITPNVAGETINFTRNLQSTADGTVVTQVG